MSVLVASLLLWGLTLDPATKAAVVFETKPSLWAEPESLLEPWANVTLRCQARWPTLDFQLLKGGVMQELVHLSAPTMEHQFPLGAVTGDHQGLYRCRSRLRDGRWTALSNLLEVTGTEPLPPPWLSTEPVPWITPGLNTTLLCHGGLLGVTFLLRREGDDEFLEVAEAGQGREVTFPVHRAGNYSCSYRTHSAGDPSEPSATVSIEEMTTPPPPSLNAQFPEVLRPGDRATLICVAPLDGVHFQLRRRGEELLVPRSSTSPDRVFFHLNAADTGDSGPYTCRYRLRSEEAAWSADSAPTEPVWSDETLPAPVLVVEPEGTSPASGSLVRLRCRAPRAGLRFALSRQGAGGPRLSGLLSPAGPEAVFELPEVSAADTANYSCIYVDPTPPFAGSARSAPLELRVDGLLPRPRLRALWSGPVPAGRDAVLRCESHVPDVAFELLRAGEEEPSVTFRTAGNSADLVLEFVGPQHAGNYSCRYHPWGAGSFPSRLSDPVELLVAGSLSQTSQPCFDRGSPHTRLHSVVSSSKSDGGPGWCRQSCFGPLTNAAITRWRAAPTCGPPSDSGPASRVRVAELRRQRGPRHSSRHTPTPSPPLPSGHRRGRRDHSGRAARFARCRRRRGPRLAPRTPRPPPAPTATAPGPHAPHQAAPPAGAGLAFGARGCSLVLGSDGGPSRPRAPRPPSPDYKSQKALRRGPGAAWARVPEPGRGEVPGRRGGARTRSVIGGWEGVAACQGPGCLRGRGLPVRGAATLLWGGCV
ncbi:alpha-1B-glycoprotein [Marmota flaviventris]|uniref:alpha-1B-glycoprotein n=1 Tax=Marmota flaviventris TaxID=93162 RepID=UPI003A86E847